jgi:hypothetical protein
VESAGRKRGCTYRRVVCSVYKESCLFLADGYRRKTICPGDLECFVSPLSPPVPPPLNSLGVIRDANKTSSLPIVRPTIRGPIRRMDAERQIDRSRPREPHVNQPARDRIGRVAEGGEEVRGREGVARSEWTAASSNSWETGGDPRAGI